ncbi:MAG TPA: tetratricopeptide repeat protein [Spongiibacteraceae bacterium]|nr:tetratricopeptide repeat protein [Spongiibacteraceae bacterium]
MTEHITDPDDLLDIALEHHQAGGLAEAEILYKKILEIDPGHPGALYLLGGIAHQDGRHEFAFELVAQVIADEPNDPDAQHLLGLIAQRLGRTEIALEALGKALELNPDYVHAYVSLGDVLYSLQRLEAALANYDRAIALQPDLLAAYSNRGVILSLLRRSDAALRNFDTAIALQPDNAQLHVYRGNVLNDLHRYAEAAQAYAQALVCDPECKYALGKKFQCELQICDWQLYAESVERVRTAVRARKVAAVPFSFLAMSPAADEQLICASVYIADQYPPAEPFWHGERYQHDKIRIAYLSADFHSHATAFLMVKFFELHDKNRFEVSAYSFGPDANDEMRVRLRNAFDHFIDVRNCTNAEIAAQLRAAEIDIAIDLKGLTGNSRFSIFAHRLAPLQILYMGYPGTLGSSYIDYMIADHIVIPPEHTAFFAEKIARLPETYWSTDDEMKIADYTPTRAELNLPASGFVFCCFNNNYKITPDVFDIWMRLLGRVDGSVFWLLEDNAAARVNLQLAARQRGIDPARLIFAPRRSLPEHLARQRRADLFLDTLPVNAHTTTTDALWAGLPVLTCLGDAFVGRVAASLLQAVGLPELITESLADYEELAFRLATTPAMLADVRAKLLRNRNIYPLFDTERFCRHMESAYITMYERQRQGLAPAGFSVAPLPRRAL